MNRIYAGILLLITFGCSQQPIKPVAKTNVGVFHVNETYTMGEFLNASPKAQSTYDIIIDKLGYSDIELGQTRQQVVETLNSKKLRLDLYNESQIKITPFNSDGEYLAYQIVLLFKDEKLVRRYLDFSNSELVDKAN